MKQNPHNLTKTVLLAATLALALPLASKAQYVEIYGDDFNGTPGASISTTTVTSVSEYGATPGATFADASNVTVNPNGNEAAVASPSSYAYLPLDATQATTYKLTATVNPSLGMTTDLGLFSSTLLADDVYIGVTLGSTGYTYSLVAGGQAAAAGPIATDFPDPITLTLTQVNPDDYIVAASLENGTSIGSISYNSTTDPDLAAINGVGFISTGGASSGILDDIMLAAVPEASSYIYGLMIFGLLAFEIGRRMWSTKDLPTVAC